MADILLQQPALVGGQYINVPTAPMRAFIQEVGAVQHPTSAELFEKMHRSQVDTERQIGSALMYVGSLGLFAKLSLSKENVRAHAAEGEGDAEGGEEVREERLHTADGEEEGDRETTTTAASTRSSAGASPSTRTSLQAQRPQPANSTLIHQQQQQPLLSHMTLLEENLLASRSAIAQVMDPTGEHRMPMSTNTVLFKKASERLTEARRIAMARGLVRRMNDDVDVKGNQQVVGEVNKVDVGKIEDERAEILKLMKIVKERHEAFLNA